MRCFVPASDDDIYALIERYGVAALVPYRVGMRVEPVAEAPVERRPAPNFEDETPRRAA